MYNQSTFSKEGKTARLFSVDALERCASFLGVDMGENIKLSTEYNRRYHRKNPWATHRYNIRQRCNDKNVPAYKDYGGRGIKCFLFMRDVKALWNRDKAWLLKRPSIDRKNNDGDYTMDNCRFIELSENCIKSNLNRRRNRIMQLTMSGILITEWRSQSEASRHLGLDQPSISQCINGKRNHCGGFTWKRK